MSNAMTKTHTKTKTKTKTMTKTKCSKDPSHAMFSKSREFKDIKYDAYNNKYNSLQKTQFFQGSNLNRVAFRGGTESLFLQFPGQDNFCP